MDNLLINYDEIDSILEQLAEIINIYIVTIQEDCDSLVELKYYKDGQAKEIFDMYEEILGKIMESADMYYLAYRLTENIKSNMQALDRIMAGLIGQMMR